MHEDKTTKIEKQLQYPWYKLLNIFNVLYLLRKTKLLTVMKLLGVEDLGAPEVGSPSSTDSKSFKSIIVLQFVSFEFSYCRS